MDIANLAFDLVALKLLFILILWNANICKIMQEYRMNIKMLNRFNEHRSVSFGCCAPFSVIESTLPIGFTPFSELAYALKQLTNCDGFVHIFHVAIRLCIDLGAENVSP